MGTRRRRQTMTGERGRGSVRHKHIHTNLDKVENAHVLGITPVQLLLKEEEEEEEEEEEGLFKASAVKEEEKEEKEEKEEGEEELVSTDGFTRLRMYSFVGLSLMFERYDCLCRSLAQYSLV
jgi:hypothetical protein